MANTELIAIENGTFTAEVAGHAGDELVLLLHGFPNSRHSWTSVIDVVAEQGFRVVAPDQRGYSPGLRPGEIADYAIDQLAADVLKLADAQGANKFHVVGHDWGGQVAWYLAAHFAGRLHSLSVLSRPHPGAFQRALERDLEQASRSSHHRRFQDLQVAAKLLNDDARAVRNTLCYERADGAFGEGVGSEVAATKRRMSDAQAAQHLAVIGSEAAMNAALNWYRATMLGQPAAADEFPVCAVPTLYIWGDEDSTVGAIAANATRQFVSASYAFKPLAGVGHFAAEEAPALVTAALIDHLRVHREVTQ